MDFLRFAFSSGWHFVGVVLLIVIVLDGLADIAKAARKPEKRDADL
jgi:hypothetical protein